MKRIRTLAAALVVLAALLGSSLPAQRPAPLPQPRPKLVVVIVVDQMRADYIERFRGRWSGGLRRLVDQGAWFANAAYPYAATETCPGHATVSTGVFPATHGIIGNTWWDRQVAAVVTCTRDSAARRVGLNGAETAGGDSARRLLAPGFAEQVRRAIPNSRVVTMSVKARSAIMLAGRQADASLWLDESTGALLTSTDYGAELPAFARRFAAADPITADFSKVWQLSAPLASDSGGRSPAGQGSPGGWTAGFPHALSEALPSPGSVFVARWRTSPFSDAWLGRLADAAIDDLKLGAGPGVDFLGIGFSATDYVGHAFGPDSIEIEADMLALDKTIGALLAKLDRSVGAGKYVVALTADHGVAPIPEQARQQGRDAGRVDARPVVARIEKALAGKLGAGPAVAQFVPPDIYFASDVAGRVGADPALWRTVRQAAMAGPGIADAIWLARGTSANAAAQPRHLRLERMPERSGDAWIGLQRNWIFSAGNGTGTTHGTAHDYDQRVPVILFGAGIKPGRYPASTTPADIAPTLAALSGVRIARTDGRVLREALAPAAAAAAAAR